MAPKKKAQAVSLTEFLGGGTGSWADDMDGLPTAPASRDTGSYARGDNYLASMPDRKDRDAAFAAGGGGIGGGFSSGYAAQDVPLPTKPPFTAFIGNLSFDVTEGEVHDFFAPLPVTSVRLVSGHDGRPKGFGYVEFESVDALKSALADRSGASMGGRTVRISVAEAPRGDRPGFGPSVADEASQWRRAGPLPGGGSSSSSPMGRGGYGADRGDREGYGRRESSFGRGDGPSGFDNMELGEGGRRVGFGSQFTATPDRPGYARGGSSMRADREPREPLEPSAGDEASNWRTGKPVAPAPGSSGPGTPRGDRPPFANGGSRRESATDVDEKYAGLERMGFGAKFSPAPQSPAEGAPAKRPGFGFGERKASAAGAEGGPAPADDAETWRSARKGSTGPPSRKASTAGEAGAGAGAGAGAAPERKKLELKPRSEAAAAEAAQPSAKGSANPFGAAKPVDAAERERQIEEKIRQRDAERAAEREKKREEKKERKPSTAAGAGASGENAAAAGEGAAQQPNGAAAGGASAEEGAPARRPSGPAGTQNPPTNPWKKIEPKKPAPSSSGSGAASPAAGPKSPRSPNPQGQQQRRQSSNAAPAQAPAAAASAAPADGKSASADAAPAQAAAPAPSPAQQARAPAPTGAWGAGRKASGALAGAGSGSGSGSSSAPAAKPAAPAAASTEKDNKDPAAVSHAPDAGAEAAKAVEAVEIKDQ